ncbi:DoxX family membrane protein [bacterium]|nr:MAG: DoxX family membrane protein [bacterium]
MTMKTLLNNPHLVLLVRLFIGLLFIVSSLEKIVDPAAFAQSIASYKLLPTWLPVILATVLPWLELLCGFSVLFGAFTHGSSFLLSAMLLVFTVAVIAALVRGLDISCGCFTQDPTAGKIGWMKVLQNTTLIVLTLFLYFSNTESFTLLRYLRESTPLNEQSR